MPAVISQKAVDRRRYWVGEIQKLSGNFGDDSTRLEEELAQEVAEQGAGCLLDHLRLCGDIPEEYGHDSSEEKQYSKYTDAIISETFKFLGFRSLVLKERADAADVEVFAEGYSLVADAKAFRLSRTAKNQKDFKVQAMDGWKRGKPYAMVVCPIYQLPNKSSQIYEQASTRNVCIFTYSHLAVLVSLRDQWNAKHMEALLLSVFQSVATMNPSKDAASYWSILNRTIYNCATAVEEYWRREKVAAVEAIQIAKSEALGYLAREREKIMRLGHEEALQELIRVHKINSRIDVINSVTSNRILDLK